MEKTMMIFTFLFTVMSLAITAYSLFSCFHQKNHSHRKISRQNLTYNKNKLYFCR